MHYRLMAQLMKLVLLLFMLEPPLDDDEQDTMVTMTSSPRSCSPLTETNELRIGDLYCATRDVRLVSSIRNLS